MEPEKSNTELSIIIPVFNEQDCIAELYNRIIKSISNITNKYEIIFVNDGSYDGSLFKIIEISKSDRCVFYISLSRNFGHQVSVTAGLDYCSGNAVVIIDADLQDPPELIPELYRIYREGYEVVYAKRSHRNGENWFKLLSAKIFYRVLENITTIKIPVDTGDFRLIDKKIVNYLKLMPEQNKFLRGQIAWLGFRQTCIKYTRDGRKHGKTGYPLSKMIRFAFDGITSFSDRPLKLVTQFGATISIISFFLILEMLYGHFIRKVTIVGWTSLIVSIIFFGGIQLLSIGIIGLYISRMNRNINNRPLYIISNSNVRENIS